MARTKNTEVTLNRRESSDRRESDDRRSVDSPVAEERRKAPRRKVQRRRQIDPTTCERDYTDQEIEFMQAMDAYKRSSGRMFPTCSEILEVLRDLGYRQVGNQEATPQGTTPEAMDSAATSPETAPLESESEVEEELELELDESEEA